MPALDLTSLQQALGRLEGGLREAMEHPSNDVVRDGGIQRFEYSHEVTLKFIKRILEMRHGDPVDTLSYNDLLRTAAERGYISDVEAWFDYCKCRNQTSHTYDAAIAQSVFTCAEPFLQHARFFLARLEELPD